MRVLLVNKYFHLKGGAERALFTMDECLREAGHETVHFAMRDELNRPSAWSEHFVSRVGYEGPVASRQSLVGVGRMFYSREVRRSLGTLVAESRPDVAVLHNVYHQLGPAVVLELAARGVPMAMVLHDFKVVCPAYTLLRDGRPCMECRGGRFVESARHGCGGSRARGVLLAAESLWQWRVLDTYRAIDRFIAPSRFMIDTVRSMGFPFELSLLRNAVDIPDEPIGPAQGRAIGFAGRLSPEKGLDVLLDAAALHPDIPLRIAGEGPLDETVRGLVRRRGLDNVTLLGRLSHQALLEEMRGWRAAVIPSRFVENCPFAILEPFSLGIPVIGTDVGGMRELLQGRGLLTAFADPVALGRAMAELWGDPERSRELGRAGRDFARAECNRDDYGERLVRLLPR